MHSQLDFSSPMTERTPRVVAAAKLLRRAGRRKAGRCLVEGVNCVDAAIVSGAATDLFMTESAASQFAHLRTAASHMGVYVHPITEKAAKALADTVHSTGVFAVCKDVLWEAREALGRRPQLVAVPVETSEPGNAGAIVRVADAVGASAVVFAGNATDPASPKAARASAGSLFHLPVAIDADPKAALQRLRAKGLQIVATCADGEVSLDDADELLARPTAWLFGNEAHGLSPEMLEAADHRIRIPIRGSAESLNLATASAICLYASAKALHRKAQAELPASGTDAVSSSD